MGKLKRALGIETLSEEPLGDYSADVTPPARSSATVVTEDRALALPAVFRGVQIIAGMGSQLRVNAWRGEEKVTPAPALVTRPDPWRSLRSFLYRTIICLIFDGNAFWLRHRDAAGNVVGLEVLNPRHVWVRWDKGVKRYDYFHRGRRVKGATDHQIRHVWGMELYGHSRGIGPITACRLAVEGIANVREYADQWFANGEGVGGILSTDQALTPQEIKLYKRIFYGLDMDDDDPDKGRVGPRVRITGKGLTYEAGILKPADAQWLESQAMGVLDVARMLGLPGDYLLAAVEGTSLTYANLSMIDTQMLKTTLFPNYLRPIEEAITEELPRGQEARFSTEEFLRPDEKTQAEVDEIYLRNRVVSAEEIRTRKGWTGPAPATDSPTTTPQTQEAPAP